MSKLSTHTHECPRCGMRWECGEANYQDECPYPLKTLCTKCWAQGPARAASLDPQHGKVEFENTQVRELRWHLGPHEKVPMHEHPTYVQINPTDQHSPGDFYSQSAALLPAPLKP